MKKLLVAALILGGAACANAQEDYAPKAGNFSTELQFNPFGNSGSVFQNGSSISDGAVFSGTYFCTDNFAVTFDFGLGGTNKKTVQYVDPTADNPQEQSNTKTYNGTFTLALGAKYYFYNYKRVNLYCGAKVAYYHDFAGTKTVDVYDPVTQKDLDSWTWSNTANGKNTGNGFGIYANTGIDFSIYKGLYVGAEINVGFKDTIYRGATAKSFANGQTTTTKTKVGGHNLEGGFGVTPLFRVGWTF
ncbi:MAG: hypothetical protein J1F16_07755 [Muribaculaceae bacterium]|nr:hypothetical protein [Muribaculaceae bacterium]